MTAPTAGGVFTPPVTLHWKHQAASEQLPIIRLLPNKNPMIKILKTFSVILLVLGLLSFAFPAMADGRGSSSTTDCHKSKIYCAYPGDCDEYIDSNNDGYCDNSIPSSGNSTNISRTSILPSTADTTDIADTSPTISTTTPGSESATVSTQGNRQASGTDYNLLLIILIIVIVYATTYFLSAKNIISALLHRKLWNITLLISSISMLILGLLLTLREEYNMNIQLPFDITFWHVEFGIIMGMIAVFHMAWHWRYYFRIKPAAVKDK
jgi:hypothetical protein